MEYLFDCIYHELYPPGTKDNPYEIEVEDGSVERRSWREAGITVAMVQAFCNVHKVSVHVLWGELKVSSFTPSDSVSSLCLYVWGDHAFFVDDRNTKAAIAQMKTSKPSLRPEVVLKTISKNEDPPTSEWLPWTGEAVDGAHHYYSEDLAYTRGQLHSRGLCPKVSLSGVGSLKALRTGDAVIHRLLPEAAVCEVFAEEFARLCKRPLLHQTRASPALPTRPSRSSASLPSQGKSSRRPSTPASVRGRARCAICAARLASTKPTRTTSSVPLRWRRGRSRQPPDHLHNLPRQQHDP